MIVLDTHVLIWWATGNTSQLSSAAQAAIAAEQNSGKILVSSISAWELARLVACGRLALSMDVSEWLELVGQIDGLSFVPVDNEILVKSVGLPGALHDDPADRVIIATARKYGAPLITADELIRNYAQVKTVW